MKIYAITKGTYSDYHICALTVDKNRAERLKKIYSNNYEEAIIEIYEDGESAELRIPFMCWIYSSSEIQCVIADGQNGDEEIRFDRFGGTDGRFRLFNRC